MTGKPTVPEVMPIVQAIYAKHAAGCCWHVVLDDGNVEDSSVQWCVSNLDSMHDNCRTPIECAQLAELLPRMSRTQRLKLASGDKRRCR